MKPEITGWRQEVGEKAEAEHAQASNTAPERKASTTAAARYSGAAGVASLPIAAAVISETTATGPTASARLVPNTA